ncbi:MAG: hypothetical protein IPP91_15025 [Betaproteobacteria bacterium]|nr:hypothetical protein [Betaproteobacteria bacterium]
MTLGLAIALPCLAQSISPMVVPDVAARIAEARETGYWLVQEGDQLYRICRHFAADRAGTRRLAREIELLNPNAFPLGEASPLTVGARIRLPDGLVANGDAPVEGARPRHAAGPSSASTPLVSSPAAPANGVAPLPAEARAQVPARATLPPYVDRLIDGASPDPDELGAATPRRGDESPGLRNWAIEARGEHREVNAAGRSNAGAIGLRYEHETELHGDFTLVGQASYFDTSVTTGLTGKSSQSDFTLFHDNFALTTDYFASSALGVIRPVLPTWLSTSYRITLAPSLLQGVTTNVTGAASDYRVAVGQLGRYSGFGIQHFERTSGSLASASALQRLDADWMAGAAAIAIRDSATIPDHTSASLALVRDLGPGGAYVKAQLAASDNGQGAGWVDANLKSGRLTQRFGAFHVDPDFLYGESTTARDSQGAYWRGDYRLAGDYFGGGVEFVENNLRRDPAKGGTENIGGFGNVTLRLDRTTQLSAGLALRDERPRVAGIIERLVMQGNASITNNNVAGQTRLDWNSTRTRPEGFPLERSGAVNWNQDWPRVGPLSLNTLVGYSDDQQQDRRVRRKTASLAARGDIANGLRVDATITYVDSDDTLGSDRNYNTAVGLEWLPTSDLSLHLTWYRNRIQPGADNPLSPFLLENSVMLTVRYEGSAGVPYPRAGETGRSASGTIVGSVFFDENNDGTRQATERGAPNVIVILDDRHTANTDADGRFSFPLVPAGRHRIRTVIERIPLPWGLEDEAPREVAVDVRTDTRIEIGLSRISP